MGVRPFTIAVVSLIVDDHDVLELKQIATGALEHRPFGFQFLDLSILPTLHQAKADSIQLVRLAALEDMIVDDLYLRLVQVLHHVLRHKLAATVIAISVGWL